MTTIKVNDMMCNHCVGKITKALEAEKLTFEVSLENKTVTIDGCSHCVATAKAALEKAGFTPEV
ncbi:MAG: heavy-metal-associated domain-containing protein [Oscillospiraceae bacterium]|nr:heavy-metal-associated domain-containing protein [Oscillospiraceae bacterium]